VITEFRIEDAQKLADMFNASDEGWPTGITGGMPITAEIVVEYKKKEDTISSLVVWDGDKIVGVLELTEFWRDTDVLYVGFLNVIPSHHGKGYGRDLLKACVEKCAELKCKRVDLHTWSGNMKAVPVYKKTGFFWVPKTLVHMKNFLPLILNMDAAKPYFENHDWYKTSKREIKVEEDDFEGTFPYYWEENGDTLSVTIDAESGGVTHFENTTFFISQKVKDAFVGRPVQVTWKIKSKTDTPLHVNLISRGEKGISIDTRESLVLKAKEETEITAEAFIDIDAEIRKKEEPPLLLATDVVINGKSLSLVSGLRAKHPIEVSTHPEYLFVPEGEQEILVVLKNNQKEKAEGTITCQNTKESHNFSIDPEYTEAVPFTIQPEDGQLQFLIKGTSVIHTIPVQTRKGANVMQKGKEVILENAHVRVVISLRGGETSIINKKTRRPFARQMSEELGPPFWPSELFKNMYTVSTESYRGKAVAEFTVQSKKFKARLTRRIEMDSSPIITINHTMIPEKDISLHFTGEGSLDGGVLTIPLQEGIISEPTMEDEFPLEDGDLPKDPSHYKEQWVCHQRDGTAFGVVWEKCTEIEPKFFSLINITMDVHNLKPIYLYAGSGTWKDVRALWSRIHRKEVSDVEEKPKRIWEVKPSIILCTQDKINQEVTLESYRGRPFKGVINNIPFEVKRGNPFTFEVLYANLDLGVNTRDLPLETALFEKKVPVSIVRVGTSGKVTTKEEDIIEIDNGLYSIKVAPRFCGSVIFFGRETNHLLTSYPEPTQLAWFRPWYGGIHPVVYQEERNFPGRMHKETFTHTMVSFENHGILWKGVKVTSKMKEIKGIQSETVYATTAFSNVMVIEHALKNVTSAPFDLSTGMSLYLQPEGSVKDATLYYHQEGLQERRRTQYGGWAHCHDWAAVKGGTTWLTLVTDSLQVADLGKEGAHLFTVNKTKLPPRSTVTSVSFFAAADSLEQSQKYKVLRGLKWT